MEISSSSKSSEMKRTTQCELQSDSRRAMEEKWVFSISNTQFNRLHGNCFLSCVLFHPKELGLGATLWLKFGEQSTAVQFNIKLAHVLLFVCFLHSYIFHLLLRTAIHSSELDLSSPTSSESAVGEHARIVLRLVASREKNSFYGSRWAENFNLFVMYSDCDPLLALEILRLFWKIVYRWISWKLEKNSFTCTSLRRWNESGT